MAVKITLTEVGTEISSILDLWYSVNGTDWLSIGTIDTTILQAGYSFEPPMGAYMYQVRDVGSCNAVLEFACSTTTTTTISILPWICWNIQIPDALLTYQGEDLYVIRVMLGGMPEYEYIPYYGLSNSDAYPGVIDTNLCASYLQFCYGEFGEAVYLPGILLTSYGTCADDSPCTGVPGWTTTSSSSTTTSTTTEIPTTTTTTTGAT